MIDNIVLWNVRDCIGIRLLELGHWDFYWVASQFYTPCKGVSQACANSLRYKSVDVSVKLLATAGWYIEALNVIKNDCLQISKSCPLLKNIISKIDKKCLPVDRYVSWGLDLAVVDTEAQAEIGSSLGLLF
jgi:hypothetical protein